MGLWGLVAHPALGSDYWAIVRPSTVSLTVTSEVVILAEFYAFWCLCCPVARPPFGLVLLAFVALVVAFTLALFALVEFSFSSLVELALIW